MEKLVRDKMPEWCNHTPGRTPMYYRVAKRAEMPLLLARKLVEEAEELVKFFEADKIDHPILIEGLADIEEVLLNLYAKTSVLTQEVRDKQAIKQAEKGSFSLHIVWNGER